MIIAQQNSGNERIRGPKLAVLVKGSPGVPMEEALRRADEANAVIASNKRLSKALVGSNESLGIIDASPCWSGTMTAYDKSGHKLGKTIEYADSGTGIRYVFPVPEEHQGKKNVLLVAEHQDFTLEADGKTMVVEAREVGIVSEFPTASKKWYNGDAKYDLPTGKKVGGSNESARYLWRTDKWVGLVARGGNGYGGNNGARGIYLDGAPADAFGVAVEAAFNSDAPGEFVATGPISSKEAPKQLTVREENGRLIVEGSPEQIAAAARLIEQLKTQ